MSIGLNTYLEVCDKQGELSNALAKFRALVPLLPRNATGEYGPYTDAAGIWEYIRKPLSECGLSVRQPVVSVGGDGGMAVVTTVSCGNSYERSTVLVPQESDEPWADVSLVARQALMRALSLASETHEAATDDPDSMSKGARVAAKRKKSAQPKDRTVELATKALSAADVTPEVRNKYLSVLAGRVRNGLLAPEAYRQILTEAGIEEEVSHEPADA